MNVWLTESSSPQYKQALSGLFQICGVLFSWQWSQFDEHTTLICADTPSVENALQIPTDFGRISGQDFLIGLVHRRYHRPAGGAAQAVEFIKKGELEIFTELNPCFLIHVLAEGAIICIKIHKGSISNNLCIVTTVDINNHVSPNVTSTNSSLHTHSFVNPRSTFLNFAVFNPRSVSREHHWQRRWKWDRSLHRYRDFVKWRWFRQYCSVICGRLFLQEFF